MHMTCIDVHVLHPFHFLWVSSIDTFYTLQSILYTVHSSGFHYQNHALTYYTGSNSILFLLNTLHFGSSSERREREKEEERERERVK